MLMTWSIFKSSVISPFSTMSFQLASSVTFLFSFHTWNSREERNITREMGRAPCCSKVGLHRGPWTPREDTLLTKYIQAHGEGHWRSLPKKAGNYISNQSRLIASLFFFHFPYVLILFVGFLLFLIFLCVLLPLQIKKLQ